MKSNWFERAVSAAVFAYDCGWLIITLGPLLLSLVLAIIANCPAK